jgi:Bacterial Ig-like domain (group 3)
LIRRGLRLELVAAMGIALAVPAVAFARESAPDIATQTTLTVEAHDQAGRTSATLAISVLGDNGLPAAGAVTISDQGHPLAGAALNKQGQARLVLSLSAGDHSLTAAYAGDAVHRASASVSAQVQGQATTTPDFQVSVAPATLSLKAGQSGSVTASVTPENASGLTAPMFVTLSCSGLPDQSSCVFTPENIEILPNATAAITSDMVILTQQASASAARPGSSPIALAILLPGALALGSFAFFVRRRPWLQRLSLLALVALVTLLGATACNPRYDYEHHGPPINPATPAGTYTIDVTAQSSNGVNAITHTSTLALTVQ